MKTDSDAAAFAALIDQLSTEHAELIPCADKLLDLAVDAGAQRREAVASCAARLQAPLDRQIVQEDDVLFPAYARASGNEGLVALCRAEHRDILALREELMAACENADSPALGALATRLAELLDDHMRREDAMLLASARAALC